MSLHLIVNLNNYVNYTNYMSIRQKVAAEENERNKADSTPRHRNVCLRRSLHSWVQIQI